MDLNVTTTFNFLVDGNGQFVRGFVHKDQQVTFRNNTTGKIVYDENTGTRSW